MDKLKKTIIYVMRSINYIGSTQTSLRKRLHAHCGACYNPNNKKYNMPVYKYIRKHNLGIELIPIKVLFLSSKSAKMVEQYYIEQYNSIENGFNCVNAYRYNKKAKQATLAKSWYERNKELSKARANKRYKEKKGLILKQEKARRKKNWNKIKARNSIKKKCNLCGCSVNQYGMNRHQQTDKCKRLSKTQNQD
tara:strand:+ start:59 stop:637 length:579 start_codon:yes stop_codon:yes gene_type:complete